MDVCMTKGGSMRYLKEVKSKGFSKENKDKKINVAAYVRVSTAKDAQLHSLEAQVSYYQDYIARHKNYVLKGIFSDAGITGTKEHRTEFERMIALAKDKQIDLILVKSISRFARNTVTLLQIIRELKTYGVDAYFEEQNIHTLSSDGELMLTILASYAQEESRSVSENMKWRIRKNFEEGKAWNTSVLGYKLVGGVFQIIPDEALIVKRIYRMFLEGSGAPAIAKALNEDGLKTKRNKNFNPSCVKLILTNYLYTGNLLLQRFYKNNHIDKKKVPNNGELPKYHAEDTHAPIISLDDFIKVQTLIKAKQDFTKRVSPHKKSVLTGKLVCANCGAKYHRRTTPYNTFWICGTYSQKGKKYCNSKQIPEDILIEKINAALRTNAFNETLFLKRISSIEVKNNNELTFIFKDKSPLTLVWEDKSRSLSWSLEMREEARRKAIIQHHGKDYSYTIENQSTNSY